MVHTQLGARVIVRAADIPPALLATLKHAASMTNPDFYDRQRRGFSTWNVPRFLRSYDETLDGDLVLPRGLLERMTALVIEAGSKVETTDIRSPGLPHEFTFAATLDPHQQTAHAAMAGHDLGVLVAPPASGRRSSRAR